nr:signal peptide, CUB and EGF-like domain-containing protein 3 [Caretta caretta]
MPCPAGTWNERRGAQDASWCLPCPPGFFCNVAGQVSPAGLCAPGYYCTGGTQTPRPLDAVTGDLCPKGHFCLAGSAAPSPCPDGEYSNATGQDKCFPCPAGFHCQHGIMQHCPPGFYCPQKTGISFYPCPAGTYNPSHGISQAERCQQCPAGMFCGEWGLSSPSGPCWPGFFCTAGTYNNLTRQAACSPCAAGYYCPENTTSYHTYPCPPGFYCPKGWFCVSAAWTAQPFDLDNYTNANCLCPATATGGKCLAGFYCPEGSLEPIPCPPGFYCQVSGLSEPSGKCAAGFYCTGGAASSKPMDGATGNICPLGTYCSEYLECPEPGMLGLLISDFATKY